jgi:hypothetical protein
MIPTHLRQILPEVVPEVEISQPQETQWLHGISTPVSLLRHRWIHQEDNECDECMEHHRLRPVYRHVRINTTCSNDCRQKKPPVEFPTNTLHYYMYISPLCAVVSSPLSLPTSAVFRVEQFFISFFLIFFYHHPELAFFPCFLRLYFLSFILL